MLILLKDLLPINLDYVYVDRVLQEYVDCSTEDLYGLPVKVERLILQSTPDHEEGPKRWRLRFRASCMEKHMWPWQKM